MEIKKVNIMSRVHVSIPYGRRITVGGSTVHNDLSGRDSSDCHPLASISGLVSSLSAKANSADLGAVAISNDYDDLDNKPTFKTINNETITGTGNIEISGGGGDSIEATLLSSNELKFDNAYQYGTIAAPRTGDMTINFTDAKLGMIQTMYHDDTELPAEILSNAKFLVVWGFYEPDTVNRLSFELIDKTVDSEMILVTIIPVE